MPEKIYWVYILLCSNQSFYTGYTDNLEKRFQDHLSGKGGK
nr:GIY-YIG nuclease family protein [Fluoribacter gormanii]